MFGMTLRSVARWLPSEGYESVCGDDPVLLVPGVTGGEDDQLALVQLEVVEDVRRRQEEL